MTQKFVITWDNMQMYTRQLAEKLLPANQWKGIIAVSRGGLVPAAILARELGLRHVDTVCISSYDHDHQRDMRVLSKLMVMVKVSLSLMTWLILAVLLRKSAKCTLVVSL